MNGLLSFAEELRLELQRLLSFWATRMPDPERGGFFGQMDHQGEIHEKAPKGTVLHARILWAFSTAYLKDPKPEYRDGAQRAYDFLCWNMHDTEFGGMYWSVTATGEPLETKKQLYAIAFAIYGLSAYYHAFRHLPALKLAKDFFKAIERHGHDAEQGGYLEAFTREWQPIADLRLSQKDENAEKTMNTHLHLAEAYAMLYTVWPDPFLYQRLHSLLELIYDRFLDKDNWRYRLFFSNDWQEIPGLVSFGHDIESAWLLLDCAKRLGDPDLVRKYEEALIPVADAVLPAIDSDGGLWYEATSKNGLVREKHWWPQSEMEIGFFDAWLLSGNQVYLGIVLKNWNFVKEAILEENAEWRWGILADGSPMPQDRAGFWKCPYHNSRGCLELMSRIEKL